MVLEQETFYPSLVQVQPRKTRSCLTVRLLMGRKKSNQTKYPETNLSLLFVAYGSCEINIYWTLAGLALDYGHTCKERNINEINFQYKSNKCEIIKRIYFLEVNLFALSLTLTFPFMPLPLGKKCRKKNYQR